MEKSRIVQLILKNLYNGNILSNEELCLDKDEYAEILDLMQRNDLISGVTITNHSLEGLNINNQHEKITLTGISYLMENTVPDHEYKIKVSVDETLEGVEFSVIVDTNGAIRKYKKVLDKSIEDIDIETESFIIASEGLKKEKEEFYFCSNS